mgnify:CR=1 FL=1
MMKRYNYSVMAAGKDKDGNYPLAGSGWNAVVERVDADGGVWARHEVIYHGTKVHPQDKASEAQEEAERWLYDMGLEPKFGFDHLTPTRKETK